MFSNIASAATYYLSAVDGNDSNPGTSAEPWKTLAKALSIESNGDVFYLRNGNYGDFSKVSAKHTNWITYQADAGTSPMLTSISINASTAYYKFDGLTITPGKENGSPGTRLYYGINIQASTYVTVQNCTVTGTGYASGDASNAVASVGIRFDDSSYITIDNCVINGNNSNHWGAYGGFCYGLGATSHPCHNVVISNCNISGNWHGISTVWGRNWTVTGNTIHDVDCDAIRMEGTSNTVISDNHLYNMMGAQFFEESLSATYSNSTKTITVSAGTPFADYALNGFYRVRITRAATDPNWYVIVSNTSNTITLGSALGADYSDITKLELLYDNHTDGIQGFYGGDSTESRYVQASNITITRNKIHNSMRQLIFLAYYAGDKAWRQEADGITIQNNLLYDSDQASPGTYTAPSLGIRWCNNVNISNNTILCRCRLYTGAQVNVFANNIIYNTQIDSDIDSAPAYDNFNLVQQYSYGDLPFGTSSRDLTLLQFKALFTDYDNDDFTLSSGSTAVGFANSDYAPSTDVLNVSRVSPPDAGCYAYVSADPNSQTYSIAASAGSGGAISPSGTTQVNESGSQTYTITPAAEYHVVDVLVDGISVVAVSSYSFTNVTANHTIAASFAVTVSTYSIVSSAGIGGAISPSGTTQVNGSGFQEYTITPGAEYHIADVLVDGTSVGAVSSYSFTNVTANHTIAASFAIDTYSIVASAGSGGAISPSGTTQVNGGGSQEYTITAEAEYHIADVLVDGISVGAVSSYSFTNITANHTIAAVFDEQDETAPRVTNYSPEANSIQIPLNHLVILHIVDAAKGVDANSITITINENTVYTGNTADYNSEDGRCRRTGNKTDYKFIYQSKTLFDFDETMTIAVNAADLEGNVMTEYSYSFKTEMRAFGKNKQVDSASGGLSKGRPATVRDSSGNIWAVWHAGPTGSRDIYVGKLTAGADNFSSSIRLTTDALDQCNAAIAIDNSGKLYVVWQDNRRENWDIYVSTSIDGINWSAETRVTDSNANEINPVIAVDGSLPNKAYIVWQDDCNNNQDIYIASSSDGFATKVISQITFDASNQTEPAVAVDFGNTVYVVWTDARGGSSDIYGAASNNLWTNVPIVNKAKNQSSPAIAIESAGSILHLLWVDDTPGNKDIYYASSNGLPGSPLTGNSIIDDDSGADQLAPAIITTGTGDDLKAFACWQDERNVINSNADTDLYFVEASAGGKTNVLVGDDNTSAKQSVPAIRIDGDGHPYLVWADTRNTKADIYYAGSTFSEPSPLTSEDISALSNTTTTVGTKPESITSVDGVSITVPARAYLCDIKITISRVKNPPKIAMERFSLPYEFGPSGAEFAKPVTITIPYEATASSESTSAYWYNPLTATLSQEGITNVEDIVISPTLRALRFQTTHFTQFFIGGGGSGSNGGVSGIGGGGGGGAGGCSISHNYQGNLVEFLLPYIGLMVVMLIIKRRDTQNRKTRKTT